MTRQLFLPLLMLAVVLPACSKDEAGEPQPPEPDMAVFLDEALSVAPEGGDVKLRIKANKPWRLAMPQGKEYLNGELHSREGEAGETEVIFTAFPNTGVAARSTTFELTAGRAEPATVTLTQEEVRYEMPAEDEVKRRLLRLLNEVGNPRWSFLWTADKPLDQWGTEVKWKDGRLELYLNEHEMKGKIDLSDLKCLTRLRCAKNQITEIDVSDCPLLEYIDATGSGVRRIDLQGCLSLKELNAGYNNLTAIDFGWCTTLKEVHVENNALTSLDLSRCVSLERISCAVNRLSALEIPYRNNLRSLWCYENELRQLDLSDSPWLGMLNCGDNAIETLDVKGCIRLSQLWCYSNRLTEIDCSDSKETLGAYYCFSNRLRKIDVSGYRKLHELHCSDNEITDINITGCDGLGWLYCAYNQIEDIDFTGIDPHMVARIDVTGNRLLAVDLTPFVHGFHIWCKDTRTGGEIPLFFDRLEDFEHEARYEYLPGSGSYIDRGYGWWYPGEPEKGSHTR